MLFSRQGRHFLIVPLLVVWIITPLNAQPKNYFVSPNGNNSNSGLTAAVPLVSINKAIEKSEAGDTVFLLPGVYKEIIKIERKKGLPEKPICIFGFSNNSDNFSVLDGGAIKPSMDITNDWIHFRSSEWIEIGKIKFINGWTYPIQIINSSYISFNKCFFVGGRRVISATGLSTHHILVENCFWDQGGDYLWRIEKDDSGVDSWTSMHHGSMTYFNGSLIDFNSTGGSIIIRKNTIVNAFNAIRYRGKKGCDSNVEIYDNHISDIRDNDFEPEYYTFNLHIYHNFSHNIHKTVSVDNVEGGQIYYYGNVVTADSDAWSKKICTGIWKLYGTERKLTFPMYAFNNSFFTAGTAFSDMHGKAMFLKHFNNAYFFFGGNNWDLNEWNSSDVFDYDVSNKPWPFNIEDNRQEANGRIADIKFSDPWKRNLKLQSGSPGIDAGKIMSFREFDWKQSYDGKAPDIGAYENGNLVDGPPFRFMVEPGSKINYKERPRIVRHQIVDNQIIVYFSCPIDESTVTQKLVSLYIDDKIIPVESVSFPKNDYQMVIKTKSVQSGSNVSIFFDRLPKGKNGEPVTYWASEINVQKYSIQ